MINPIYKNAAIMKQMQDYFKKSKVIKLNNFFQNPKSVVNNIKFKRKYLPIEYSYEESNVIKINKKELTNFLSSFFKINKITISLKTYSHEDYSLLNDLPQRNKAEFIIDLTKKWNKNAGGYTSFIQNNKEILRIYPEHNTLTLINTKNSTKSFVKYVNCLSKNKRTVIEGTIF